MRTSSIMAVSALALIVGLALAAPRTATAFFGSLFSQYQEVAPENDEIRIAADEVSGGQAHYFAVGDIRFFVVQSPDGVLRAAFDACDVCFPERKGYSQQGELMVCNNCGQAFHVSRINEVRGGCNPAPLARVMDGGELVIRATDLRTGAHYFN